LERGFPSAHKTDLARRAACAGTGARFSGWTELKHKLAAKCRRDHEGIGQFDEHGEALLQAYRTNPFGDGTSLGAHLAPSELAGDADLWQLDLGDRQAPLIQNDDITLDGRAFSRRAGTRIRALDALVKLLHEPAGAVVAHDDKPVRLLTAETVGDESPSWHSRDWSAVVARLKEVMPPASTPEGQMPIARLEDVSRIEHITALKSAGLEA